MYSYFIKKKVIVNLKNIGVNANVLSKYLIKKNKSFYNKIVVLKLIKAINSHKTNLICSNIFNRVLRNSTGVIPGRVLSGSIINCLQISGVPSSILKRCVSTISKNSSSEILRDLKNFASKIEAKPVGSETDVSIPDSVYFDDLIPYLPLLKRFVKAQEMVNHIRLSERVPEGDQLNESQLETLHAGLTSAGIGLEALGFIKGHALLESKIVLKEGLEYKFNDETLNLSNERDLFLLVLVNTKFKQYENKIVSVDQVKAISRNNKDMEVYFKNIKSMFNFTLTIDPGMFSAGVTPAEFKQYLIDKRSVTLLINEKTAFMTGINDQLKEAQKMAQEIESKAYAGTSIIYKIFKLSSKQLPAELKDKVSLAFTTSKEIEESLAQTTKVFRKYLLSIYKTPNKSVSDVLEPHEIGLLHGFTFDEVSRAEFLEALKTYTPNSDSDLVVK